MQIITWNIGSLFICLILPFVCIYNRIRGGLCVCVSIGNAPIGRRDAINATKRQRLPLLLVLFVSFMHSNFYFTHFLFFSLLSLSSTIIVFGQQQQQPQDANPYYTSLLNNSMWFYEAQRSGRLPPDNRVPW